jgi:hypothetical protein
MLGLIAGLILAALAGYCYGIYVAARHFSPRLDAEYNRGIDDAAVYLRQF